MNDSALIEKKVFISHATDDVEVVKSFVTLLESGIGILPKNIFCTSIKGQGIRPGDDFKNTIHKNLGDATTVVALISENFYNSPFCMFELGGVWLQVKDFIPVLVPPVSFGDMKAVLYGLQALRLDVSQDIDELRDELANRLEIKLLPTSRWNEKREEFLKSLPSRIAALPLSPSVPRSQLEKVKQELSDYKNDLALAESETKRLQLINAKLMKAKDAEAVAKVLLDDLPDVEIFEKLVAEMHNSLKKLSLIVREATFQYNLGNDLYISESSRFNLDDTKRPIEYQELILNPEESGYQINKDSPKLKSVLDNLSKLKNWLSSDSSIEFYKWYSSEHKGQNPDLSDREFWDSHLWCL